MVGLVNNDPVRPAGGRPELLELRQKRVEERWPAFELDAEQVDDHVLPRLREHVKHFGDTRLALGIAEHDRSLELGIVAFRIDDAKLVLALREAFEKPAASVDLPLPDEPTRRTLVPWVPSNTSVRSARLPSRMAWRPSRGSDRANRQRSILNQLSNAGPFVAPGHQVGTVL